jgi:hypothetical protein
VSQRAMVLAARILPQPVLQRLASMAAKCRQGTEGN